jgi:hypothetical protein
MCQYYGAAASCIPRLRFPLSCYGVLTPGSGCPCGRGPDRCDSR